MKKFFPLAMVALGLFSCTDHDAVPDEVQQSKGNVFATLSLSLPQAGSRSQTEVDPGDNPAQSNHGFEYGQEYENEVKSVLVVLAIKNGNSYKRIAANLCDPTEIGGTTGNTTAKNRTFRVQFQSQDLINSAGSDVYVFAYCNASAACIEAVQKEDKFADSHGTISSENDADIWRKDGFFMSSALIHTATLPTLDQMNTLYNKESNPFNLGQVKVERAAARFDFVDTTIEGETDPNKYPIYEYVEKPTDENGTESPTVKGELQGYVTINGMALFNERVEYYYLPRVAEDTEGKDGQDKVPNMATIAICGQETRYNWVISPDAPKTFFSELTKKKLPTSFNFTMPSKDPDNDDSWNSDKKHPDYHIWRYTTENTISGVSAQKHGVSTGVLFRGEISAEPESRLGKALTSKERIYAYQDVMYGNLSQLKEYVASYPKSALAVDFQKTFLSNAIDLGTLTTKEAVEDVIKDVKDLPASTDAFNMYTPDEDGKYYVYYYYFNRHNDNGNNTVMGPMEFATVRNNVYKLKISNIYNWGTPGDKPTDPDDPDESAKTYFKVTVEVLPWVVRINNIEF